MNRRFTYYTIVILFIISLNSFADEIHIAVAANFAQPMAVLKQDFEKSSGHQVIVTLGSTGKLYSQIKNGAPFEILLAADMERPLKLSQEGETVKGSIFTYAVGKLVLWSQDTHLVDQEGTVLKQGNFTHLAIANPKTAPYGKAAQQVLEKLGLWQTLQDKLVQGIDISQAYQMVSTRNAQLGFIALSQYKSVNKGSHWLVPQEMYSPLFQGAVLLKKGEHHDAAMAFLRFLKTQQAINLIEKFGYSIPQYMTPLKEKP